MFHFLQGQQQSQTKRERVRCRVVAKHLPIQFNDRPLHRITLHGLDYTSACFQMQINIQLTKDSYMSNEIELASGVRGQVSGNECKVKGVQLSKFLLSSSSSSSSSCHFVITCNSLSAAGRFLGFLVRANFTN